MSYVLPDVTRAEVPQKKRPGAAKLLQAATLAAALVPLGSVAVETANITCRSTMSGGSGAYCDGYGNYTYDGTGTEQTNLWTFLYYGQTKYTLRISGVPAADFSLDARDWVTTQADLDVGPMSVGVAAGYMGTFLGYTCVPTFGDYYGDPHCGLFRVSQVVNNASWVTGPDGHNYTLKIAWNQDPAPDGPVTILQMTNFSPVFNHELANIQYDPNLPPPDPAASGRGDGFSTFGVFTPPENVIPEPASMILVGTGLAGALHRVRRRKR